MNKLLVNAPIGAQEITLGVSYFDESRVLWNEMVDGPLPDITLGGMVRSGDSLVFDQAVKDIHDATLTPIIAEQEREQSKLTGIEILGVMCSATKEDQNGMIAIGFDKLTNTLAGTQMGATTMEFKNGSELVITDENFSEVDALWRPFRKSFF